MTPRLVLAFVVSFILPVAAEEKPEMERSIETLRPPTIDFVAEQVGQFEQEVKEALRPVLQRHPEVRRGYLVFVLYDRKQQSVALCLEADGAPEQQIVKEVSEIFQKKAGRNVHLDIIFLNSEQRLRIKNVAEAFYVAS